MPTAETDNETALQVMQLVCFNLASEEYAVDITEVQEVVRVQRITPVPQVPPFALGVMNVRGNIVPVFDLRKKFGIQAKPLDDASKFLILRVAGAVFAIVADRILDNIKLETSQIDPAPEVGMKIDRSCIRGLGEIGSRMVIILDMAKVHSALLQDITSCSK